MLGPRRADNDQPARPTCPGGRPVDLLHGEPVQRVDEKLATQSGHARASDASGTISGPIVSGLFLNSYPLTFRGEVELFEMPGAGREYARDELRDLAGVSVWMGQTDAFAYRVPTAA